MASHDIEFYLEKTLSENPSDVAHFLKYLYYSHIRFDGKSWYSFSNYSWKMFDADDSPLIPIIKNDLVNRYLALASTYNGKIIQKNRILAQYPNEDPEEMNEYLPLIISYLTNKSRLCSDISLQLNEHTYCQKINEAAKQLFLTKNFKLRLDLNTSQIGFNNGIYNLDTRRLDLATHKHKVFLSTGYNFVSEYKNYKEMIQFWKSLELTDVLPLISSLLDGKHRKPLIWIKNLTENSLDAISQLLQWTLGDYAGQLPFSDLRKRKIPSPQTHTHPDLISNCRKRIVIVEQHPEDFPNICSHMVELLLNSDQLNLRNPRKPDSFYTPQFGIIVLSRNDNTEPTESSITFDAKKINKIKAKEEWKYDLINYLLKLSAPITSQNNQEQTK